MFIHRVDKFKKSLVLKILKLGMIHQIGSSCLFGGEKTLQKIYF
jgi:hypothetical protein